MRRFATLSVLLASCFASHVVMAQDCSPSGSCPPIEVNANTLDGSATIPVFLIPAVQAYSPNHTNILPIDDQSVDLTKAQICTVLRNNKPAGCTTSNYPAVPRIPSASGATWAGNGCGADPWSSALGAGYLTAMLPGIFSGDLNRPVEGNKSIDFTSFCNNHDRAYTSNASKQFADNQFAKQLQNFCQGSSNQQLCNGFASTYVDAVKQYGAAAYAEDQADLRCAAWGDSMKKDQCGT
jgi:hypothetical protein